MKKFENNKTVCFLGDSITTNSTWISIIYEYYLTHCPNCNIKMLGCGISGGRSESALMYWEEDLMSYNPDFVVIMYGMNECDNDSYQKKDTDGTLKNYQDSLLEKFYRDLTEVANRLKEKNIGFAFCTNTPVNEWMKSESPSVPNVGTKRAAEVTKRVANDFGAPCVDFFEIMSPLMKDSVKINPELRLTKDDRIHPNEYGNSLMASIFLNAQGFSDVAIPSPEEIADGTAFISESKRMEERQRLEMKIRYFWIGEWLLLRDKHNLSMQERLNIVKEYLKADSFENDFNKFVAESYIDSNKNYNKYFEEYEILLSKLRTGK